MLPAAKHWRKTKSHLPLICLGMKQKLRLCMPAQWNSPQRGASSSSHFDWWEAGCYRAQGNLCLELAVTINYRAEQSEVDGKFKVLIGRCSMTWSNSVPMTAGQVLLSPELSVCCAWFPTPQAIAINNEIKLSFFSLLFSDIEFLRVALAVL